MPMHDAEDDELGEFTSPDHPSFEKQQQFPAAK